MSSISSSSDISTTDVLGGESFADLFEESIQDQDLKVGEVISAEVLRIDHNYVLVNAGLKSEALIPIEEFHNDQGELEVRSEERRVGKECSGGRRTKQEI